MAGLKVILLLKKKPAEKKSRFKITWEETDTTKNTANPPVVKKKVIGQRKGMISK